MGKKYIYVRTELEKKDGKYVVEKVEKYLTGIGDAKRFMLFRKLNDEDWGFTNHEYKLWKGMKYGDRLGFDTSKQIGESFAIVRKYSCINDEVCVYELYENPEN